MRLFAAINIPSEYLKTIDVPGRRVRAYHITLKFYGEDEPEKLITELEKVEFAPFFIRLTEIGAFPKLKNARVVWAGVEPWDELLKLQKQISSERFHPHITLSRNRKPVLIEQFKLEPIEYKVDSFELIESKLTPEGPVYRTIRIFAANS